jgi:hypothetical protein
MRRFLIGLVLTLLLLISTGIGIAVARWPAWKHCWPHLCRNHGGFPAWRTTAAGSLADDRQAPTPADALRERRDM